MNKFKVGDRVKCIDNTNENTFIKLNEIYIVKNYEYVGNEKFVTIYDENGYFKGGWQDCLFELVYENKENIMVHKNKETRYGVIFFYSLNYDNGHIISFNNIKDAENEFKTSQTYGVLSPVRLDLISFQVEKTVTKLNFPVKIDVPTWKEVI